MPDSAADLAAGLPMGTAVGMNWKSWRMEVTSLQMKKKNWKTSGKELTAKWLLAGCCQETDCADYHSEGPDLESKYKMRRMEEHENQHEE